MDFASSTRAAVDRTRMKGIVVKSSVVTLSRYSHQEKLRECLNDV